MKHRNIGIALLALAMSYGCGTGADDGEFASESGMQAPINTVELGKTSSRLLDRIELDNGATVSFEESPGGVLIVGTQGPFEAQEDVNTRLNGAEDIKSIYAALAPEREIPETVIDALTAFEDAGRAALTQLDDATPSTRVVDLENGIDTFSRDTKESPRYVDWFRATFCKADVMDEASVRSTWYRRSEYCGTEKTNNAGFTFNSVKQGVISLSLYRGNANFKWSTWVNGAWKLGNTYSVNEGNYGHIRVVTTGVMNVKFEIYNATGDGYNLSLHTAQSDVNLMKLTSGNDYYQYICQCNDGFEWANNVLEACLTNSSPGNTALAATAACDLLDVAAQQTAGGNWVAGVQCTAISGPERASVGVNCTKTTAKSQLRECAFDDNCRYDCTDTCRLK